MTNYADTVPATHVPRPVARRRSVLRFTVHYVEMLVAMGVGMVALAPAWDAVWPGLADRADLHVMVMATNMNIGMALCTSARTTS